MIVEIYHYPEHSPRRPGNMDLSRAINLKIEKYGTTQDILPENRETKCSNSKGAISRVLNRIYKKGPRYCLDL